jgi:hypothetical protein
MTRARSVLRAADEHRRPFLLALLAGLAGGALAALLKTSRARSRRRREQRERAFSSASAGIWPPVGHAEGPGLRIVAPRAAGGAGHADDAGLPPVTASDEAGQDLPAERLEMGAVGDDDRR